MCPSTVEIEQCLTERDLLKIKIEQAEKILKDYL